MLYFNGERVQFSVLLCDLYLFKRAKNIKLSGLKTGQNVLVMVVVEVQLHSLDTTAILKVYKHFIFISPTVQLQCHVKNSFKSFRHGQYYTWIPLALKKLGLDYFLFMELTLKMD